MATSSITSTSLPYTAKNFLDPRDFQIAFLSVFLIYGIIALDWSADWAKYLTLVSVSVIVQAIGERIVNKDRSSWKSAVITALGLCLLLKSGELWVLALASAVAIAGKFLIRYQGKHVFNPGNFAIVSVLLLTDQAWISPGQWGSGFTLFFFFGAAAAMVLLKVGRLDTCISFLITFALLEFSRTVLFLGWGPDVFLHKMCNGSFLLFTFFMITDPVTTPNDKKARVLWSVLIAVLAFILSHWLYIHTAPIWALVIAAPITALLDRKFKSSIFQWNR
ncbi:MAG: Na+-transporting NADH:ubiquinone oxidoreductase subunit NqrB [Flavobacteriales bacterium]|jgi:Na+-transporting NADH:ubiquinone oxidoreductase subunit NqrB